jgi:hypothetical protein
MSTSAVRIVEIYKREFVDALRNGCSVRVLVPEAGWQFIRDVEEAESVYIARGNPIDEELETMKTRLVEALSVVNRGTGCGIASTAKA